VPIGGIFKLVLLVKPICNIFIATHLLNMLIELSFCKIHIILKRNQTQAWLLRSIGAQPLFSIVLWLIASHGRPVFSQVVKRYKGTKKRWNDKSSWSSILREL